MALALSAALPCSVLLFRAGRGVQAADSENITWGATDPAWSPDGRRLAFSLFGSIWQVAAEGGEAEQITTSGSVPRAPGVVSGGRPHCLRVPAMCRGLRAADRRPAEMGRHRKRRRARNRNAVSIRRVARMVSRWRRHRLRPGGARRRIAAASHRRRSRRERARFSSGCSAALPGTGRPPPRSRSGEIFFAVQRLGAPQIWSMPGGAPPIIVQMPLTSYRREDIVLLNSVSAIPDGSGVIYSANVVNGKGDYELYRVGRDRRTSTDHANLARRICAGGLAGWPVDRLRLQSTRQSRPVRHADRRRRRQARAHHGAEVPQALGTRARQDRGRDRGARRRSACSSRAADGKAYAPAGAPIYYYALEPGQRQGFFVAAGDDEFPVPAGRLQLVASKGVEYKLAEQTVDVAPARPPRSASRSRAGPTGRSAAGTPAKITSTPTTAAPTTSGRRTRCAGCEAEDLNAANMIVANNEGAFIHDKEFFTGAVNPISKPRYVLYWGQEYRNSDPLGHMAFLNIKKQVPPSYTSVIGSDSSYDFPLNTMAALEARRQGGFVSYVHPISGI